MILHWDVAQRSRGARTSQGIVLLLLLFVAYHPMRASVSGNRALEQREDTSRRIKASRLRSAKRTAQRPTESPSFNFESGVQRRRQEILTQRLRDERRRLEEQETQREALLRDSKAPQPPADAPSVSPRQSGDGAATLALRQELEAARQRLAELQVNDTDLHPDVIAAREKIALLQQELRKAESAAISPVPQPPKARSYSRPDYASELSQIDAIIKQQDERIDDDKRQLALLRSGRRISGSVANTDPSRQLPEAAPRAPAIRPAPPLIPKRSRRAIRGMALSGVVLFSLLLLAGILIIPRIRRNAAIRDSATLQGMLPTEVDYIGSIPRMKAG
jgi:hypothetical protein